jgi:hypothetical protein
MQVPVAGVKDVDHGQVLPGRLGIDFTQHLGDA